MLFLRLLPVVLVLLVLGAHFLRAGQLLPLAVVAGLLALLGVRRPWVPRAVQVALALATLEWVRTLVAIAGQRLRQGEPVVRLVAILAGVALATLLSALVLRAAPVKRWYAGGPGE
jgi:hypothetical protein